jgi:hypothetical protein
MTFASDDLCCGYALQYFASDSGLRFAAVAFEAARCHDRPGVQIIARLVVVKLNCTNEFRRSNLLEEGNRAKKGFGMRESF